MNDTQEKATFFGLKQFKIRIYKNEPRGSGPRGNRPKRYQS